MGVLFSKFQGGRVVFKPPQVSSWIEKLSASIFPQTGRSQPPQDGLVLGFRQLLPKLTQKNSRFKSGQKRL